MGIDWRLILGRGPKEISAIFALRFAKARGAEACYVSVGLAEENMMKEWNDLGRNQREWIRLVYDGRSSLFNL